MPALVNMLGVDMVELGLKPELPNVHNQPQSWDSQAAAILRKWRGE